jgi:hypothetical protein
MRPGSLRAATARTAAKTNPKLATRESEGEKRGRKRMADVGAVYDTTPVPRSSADILPVDDTQRAQVTAGPTARNKWLTASVVDDAATVVTAIFDEADRRDPTHQRTWVALVDGNVHQIMRIQAEATCRNVTVVIVIDLVHSWNTSGRPPGPSTTKAIPQPKPGSANTPRPSSTATRPASPALSDEPPPSPAWTNTPARTPTSAPPT